MKSQSQALMQRVQSGTAIAILAGLLSACATPSVKTDPVGPPPAARAGTARGYLQVYSATLEIPADNTTIFRPHQAYWVIGADGRTQWVENHHGRADETPTRVSLPVGNYDVLADSDEYGRITVPVVIETGATTTLSLDGRSRFPKTAGAGVNLVRLPDGSPIGWKAQPVNRAGTAN